jgi:hypothetical protein
MKYVIEIKEIDEAPKEWSIASNWPCAGLYTAKNESYSMYLVLEGVHNVSYISNPEFFKSVPLKETGEAVSESLLLKAIAAAAHAKVLS